MQKCCFLLSLVLGLPVSADEIVVPNFNFDEIYQPGSDTITGAVSDGGWTQGVGPDCPIDSGDYIFSDGTTGTEADIPGWIGYDRDGWVALDGTYDRDQTTGNLQGSIANQGQGVDGSFYYLANGGAWGNPAGGLIVSAAPLGNVEEDVIYTLSMVAKGTAQPVVLELLAGGIVLTPTSSVDPVLTGDYQEFSRTYDPDSLVTFLGQPLTICLGVGREATGQQSHFDNVSLFVDPGEVDAVFLRGDTDTNGRMELTDAIGIFNFLFITGTVPDCIDAADADDNGTIELTDGIRILNVLFLGQGEIPPPGFMECGPDPTKDTFDAEFGPCPYQCP